MLPPPSIHLFAGDSPWKGKRMYAGAYDPSRNALYLAVGHGHEDGMATAGGRPFPGITPGVTVLESSGVVTWANDFISLDQPALTTEQMEAIQRSLAAHFPDKMVVRTRLIR